jgi:translation elongation factor EF-Tu-like GTPase
MSQFKLIITDIFDIKGRGGPVVVGSIESGMVKVGDHITLETFEETLPVKVIYIEKFKQANLSEAGASSEDVGIELTGVTASQIKPLNVLKS